MRVYVELWYVSLSLFLFFCGWGGIYYLLIAEYVGIVL